MKKRVSFITLGCKVNQYETNAMMQKFQESGYEIVEIDEVSDICVVNTCTVTNMSDRKSRQALRKVKDKNQNAIIVATGCYAQSSKEELEKMPEIDVVLGNEEKRDIVKYVEKYFEQNQKLTAVQDISTQKEFEENIGLIDLLEEINKIDGIVRIRLGSLEPKIITEEFMQRLIKLEKICHHFHLSLQSGCDNTLKRMNRKYTTSEFKEIVQRLRRYYNDVILTTDIIVGFPGETEEDFETTYNYLKKINFYKMHVFPYSPRKGTVAAKMPNQIQGDVKERRSKRLIELSNENQKQYNQNLIGKDVDVLFEEKNKEGYYKGHTQNYILVEYKNDDELENKIVKVNIRNAKIEYVIG